MEEILASIRRIIADEDSTKAPPKAAAPMAPPRAAAPVSRPAPPPPPAPRHDDVDAMLAGLDAPPGGANGRDDILDLTESMAEPTAPAFQTIDGQPDVVFSDSPSPDPRAANGARQQAPAPPTQSVAQPGPMTMASSGLLSNSASDSVNSAFNTLAQTVLVQNARTLEDLVREMLRPMLKAWLDDNLPGMVERIIKAEIERVSRGRG